MCKDARCGQIQARRAQSDDKQTAFHRIHTTGPKGRLGKQARWIEDGKFFTSSGVSADMDMALTVMADLYGMERADRIAQRREARSLR